MAGRAALSDTLPPSHLRFHAGGESPLLIGREAFLVAAKVQSISSEDLVPRGLRGGGPSLPRLFSLNNHGDTCSPEWAHYTGR